MRDFLNTFFIFLMIFIFLDDQSNSTHCFELLDFFINKHSIKVYGITNYFVINELLTSINIGTLNNCDIYKYTQLNNLEFPRKHPLSHPHLLLSSCYHNNYLFHLGLQFSSYNYNNQFTLLSSYKLNLLPYNQYISTNFRIINTHTLQAFKLNNQFNLDSNSILDKEETKHIINNIIIENLKKYNIFYKINNV